MTAVSDRVLQAGGPALLFTHQNLSMPVLTNLFGTVQRVALGMGAEQIDKLRELGQLLAFLKALDDETFIRWPAYQYQPDDYQD
jgi:4-hydroxy-3-polyprenylbenzoate decarboxylase